jgi:protein gp37
MSDLFHDKIPERYIQRVFDVMKRASWHTFHVLTKRAERLETLGRKLDWPPNVWMGVSVETPEYLDRIDHLRRIPARIRFISFEPLLDALGVIDLKDIHWAIVGGESGPKSRPIDKTWVTEIRDQCLAARVPFFFKQWGGTNKKKAGRLLEGRVWDEMPRLLARRPAGWWGGFLSRQLWLLRLPRTAKSGGARSRQTTNKRFHLPGHALLLQA